MKLIERPKGLDVGTRVEIVASKWLSSRFVGRTGEIEQFPQPFWMARVRLDDYPYPIPFWVEELKPLETEESPV